MTIDHLQERVADFRESLEKVLLKKRLWNTDAQQRIVSTLQQICLRFPIGWEVQQLNWMFYNSAVNITFKDLPPDLQETGKAAGDGSFMNGAALVFSQLHNGDVSVFILFPIADTSGNDSGSADLGTYPPEEITEKLIIEKVDEFLKEMVQWEIPTPRDRIGFVS